LARWSNPPSGSAPNPCDKARRVFLSASFVRSIGLVAQQGGQPKWWVTGPISPTLYQIVDRIDLLSIGRSHRSSINWSISSIFYELVDLIDL
jgi:hypothetical protein